MGESLPPRMSLLLILIIAAYGLLTGILFNLMSGEIAVVGACITSMMLPITASSTRFVFLSLDELNTRTANHWYLPLYVLMICCLNKAGHEENILLGTFTALI